MSRWYWWRAKQTALIVTFEMLPPVTVFWDRLIGVRVGNWFIGIIRGQVPTGKEFTS